VAHSYGCAWGDYDNDGYLDMFVGNGDGGANALYHNDRDGTFTRITTNVVTQIVGDSGGVVWGDYDNDGDLDLFIANWRLPSFLFRNDGNGNFTRMVSQIAFSAADSFGCAWGDYDNDGFLDLVIANDHGQNEHLYRNRGDGTFTRILAGPIPTSGASSGTPAWADYDNDGKLDLAVSAVGTSADSVMLLFHNEGGGNFRRVTTFPTIRPYESGMDWGDYDNDGDLDLLGLGFVGGSVDADAIVYRNEGGGVFTRFVVATLDVIGRFTWGDYDNDGWLDFYVATYSRLEQPVAGTHLLFHSNGDGTFTRIIEGEIVSTPGYSMGAAWGDYDNDGFLDVFASTDTGNFLYHNDGNSNRWVTIKLVGTASNRSGIGAKVRVRANIAGHALWQLREVTSGYGLNGGGLRAYFGLGDATNVDLVRIEWPSGTVQELQNVGVNQILTVTEPPRLQAVRVQPDGSLQLQLAGAAGFRYEVQTSSNLSSWTPRMIVTNTSRTMLVTDPSATNALSRYYRAVGQ
jgi:hypothetical protein